MNRVVAADIFGRTPALESLAEDLSADSRTHIIDPYDGRDREFETETAAYAYFMQSGGMDAYSQKIEDWFRPCRVPVLAVGYSVGASAIWAVSDRSIFHEQTRAACFYGSQIRRMTDIDPKIEISLFFPVKEDHFDVSQLKHQLSEKKNVQVYQTRHHHGFMNRRSVNFDPDGYKQYLDRIKRLHIKSIGY